ncbi:hypothetical protein [Plantactinospora mayteni]|nr:hypothetical protein [Plantactinospora mayteni]
MNPPIDNARRTGPGEPDGDGVNPLIDNADELAAATRTVTA